MKLYLESLTYLTLIFLLFPALRFKRKHTGQGSEFFKLWGEETFFMTKWKHKQEERLEVKEDFIQYEYSTRERTFIRMSLCALNFQNFQN